MYKIILVCLLLLLCCGKIYMCIGKTNNNDKLFDMNYIKFSDQNYLAQDIYLNKCINGITETDYDLMNVFKDLWADNAFLEVKNSLKNGDQELLKIHNFVDCFRIVSEHNAKKYFCASFVEMYDKTDFIYPYVIYEYEKCIADKNKKFKNPLVFDKPEIGLNDE